MSSRAMAFRSPGAVPKQKGQEAPQDALPSRNGLGAQPPLATQPVAIRQVQLVKRTGRRRCGRRRWRRHAGIDEMLDEPCDASLPLPSRRKFTADLSGVEPAGLNLCAEPIDRALVIADGLCGIAEPAEFRQDTCHGGAPANRRPWLLKIVYLRDSKTRAAPLPGR